MNELIERLRSLTVRTKAGRMRALMPIIEERLAAGVAQQDLLNALREGGIDMTLGTFKSYLHRHRAKSRNQLSSSSRIKPEPAPSEQNQSDMVTPVESHREPAADVDPAEETTMPILTQRQELEEIMDPKKSEARLDQFFRPRPLIGRDRS